jgi:hypothetical protein
MLSLSGERNQKEREKKMLKKYLQAKLRVLLVGPPGIGKTARILAVAKELGYEVVVMRASLAERVDFGGALVPDLKAGITREIPLETIAKLRASTKPTLLFLDDLGQAPIDVQAALMRLFDNGSLPDNVVVWGATNRPADKAGVTCLCEPLRSRFDLAFELSTPTSAETLDGGTTLASWKEELSAWCDWASSIDAAPEIIAWHRATTGRTLYGWKPNANPAIRMPDFRTWETMIKAWNADIKDMPSVSAIVGKPTAVEFLAFARLATDLPTPDQVRIDPMGAPVPSEPSACYLITSMLAQACGPKDVKNFCKYAARMDRVYAALLYRDLFRRLGAKLSGDPTWVAWLTEHQALFSV